MVDIFGLKKEPETPAAPAPSENRDGAPVGAVKRDRHKLWAALLVVDSVFVIVFGGAVAAKVYQHLKAPAGMVTAQPGRRKPGKPPAPAQAAKPAESPKPAQAAKPPAAAQAAEPARPAEPAATAKPAEKRHSVPVEFKLKAARARSVHLVGAFIVRGGRREMIRQDDGSWTLTVYLLPGTNYRYWFMVDGKKRLDPDNPKTERRASVLSLP